MNTEECWTLLASLRMGRIGLSHRALPCIIPVVFALHNDDVIFNAHPDLLWRAATENHVVCFEAGTNSEDLTESWSVSVVGQLSCVTDPTEVHEAAQHLDLAPWTTPGRYVRLSPALVDLCSHAASR